eukprot:12407261-Karenia_brevis.AAC.1
MSYDAEGCTKTLDNYRPITLLPILYKLFARILYARIRTTLEEAQQADQAGFRSGFSCDDHLQAIVLLVEASAEFNTALWACAVDFRKAFDSVEHDCIWKAMNEQGVGHTKGRGLGKHFEIQRGTKQGDPLSPALFTCVLEH